MKKSKVKSGSKLTEMSICFLENEKLRIELQNITIGKRHAEEDLAKLVDVIKANKPYGGSAETPYETLLRFISDNKLKDAVATQLYTEIRRLTALLETAIVRSRATYKAGEVCEERSIERNF